MDIFIGNLPLETSVVELRKLLGEAGANARFTLFRKMYPDGGVSCFGQAEVEPDAVAEEALRHMRNAVFRDQKVEVRPLVERSYINDRRSPNLHDAAGAVLERRCGDRRNRVQGCGCN
jgi:RNA recognition motif-containing protein